MIFVAFRWHSVSASGGLRKGTGRDMLAELCDQNTEEVLPPLWVDIFHSRFFRIFQILGLAGEPKSKGRAGCVLPAAHAATAFTGVAVWHISQPRQRTNAQNREEMQEWKKPFSQV
mmetsp:Transcript_60695/g.113423  ORF Transcript_60695/g.113423 Transcript_60695/m.113423 type:complete len:116 (-) Transcript_60695:110-457(-)